MTDITLAVGCSIQKQAPLKYGKEDDIVEWMLNSQRITILRGEYGLSYSFTNVTATLIAPGFVIQLGNGAAPSDEGIEVEFEGDHSKVRTGADGKGITAAYAARNGSIRVRLLKNSPANKMLDLLFAAQTVSPTLVVGLGVLTIAMIE